MQYLSIWGVFSRLFCVRRWSVKLWAEKFYGSERWRSCRDSYMKSKDYLCERCSTNSNPTAAKIVHHKIRITRENIKDPAVTFAWANLEALCQECHNREHHSGAKEPPRYVFDSEGRVIPL